MGVGCFVLIVILLTAFGISSSLPKSGSEYHPTVYGPRQPIPNVDAATLAAGRNLYQAQHCSSCHGNIGGFLGGGSTDNSMPNLTHEGQRNASIEWQVRNLKEHSRLFPGSSMGDYDELSPEQLRALASYMATRR